MQMNAWMLIAGCRCSIWVVSMVQSYMAARPMPAQCSKVRLAIVGHGTIRAEGQCLGSSQACIAAPHRSPEHLLDLHGQGERVPCCTARHIAHLMHCKRPASLQPHLPLPPKYS